MSIEDQFKEAQGKALKLPKKPSNEELLQLYSLYKQAIIGDATGKRPGILDVVGRAKYDAWAGKKGISKEDAMKQYIKYVAELQSKLS